MYHIPHLAAGACNVVPASAAFDPSEALGPAPPPPGAGGASLAPAAGAPRAAAALGGRLHLSRADDAPPALRG